MPEDKAPESIPDSLKAKLDAELENINQAKKINALKQDAPPPVRQYSASAPSNPVFGQRQPVDEIAKRLVELTYGELKEFSAGIQAEPDHVWDWAIARTKEGGR